MASLQAIATALGGLQTAGRRSKIRPPDQFNSTDPMKLRKFLVNIQLNINDNPKAYDTDAKKISFVLSYLTGSALDWFEPEILYPDPTNLLAWLISFPAFIVELQANFGFFNIIVLNV